MILSEISHLQNCRALNSLRAKNTFIRTKMGHTVQFSSLTLYNWHGTQEKQKYCNLDSLIYTAIGRPAHIQNGVEIALFSLDHVSKPLSFLSSLNIITDLKGPNVKYKLHYGWCTGRLFKVATWYFIEDGAMFLSPEEKRRDLVFGIPYFYSPVLV